MKKGNDLLLGHIELTDKQKRFFDTITNRKTRVVFLHGSSGTGKSFLSFYAALSMLSKDKDLSIKYLRTPVESAERGLGFLKGTLEEKTSVYNHIYDEKLSLFLSKQGRISLEGQKRIETDVVNFIRGQDWSDKIVIAEEGQNFSVKELTCVLTRINENTKVIICGDTFQSDIRNSGMQKLIDVFDNEESREAGIHCLEFNKDDIMRDGVVRFILEKVESLHM